MAIGYIDKKQLIPDGFLLFSVTDINLYLNNPNSFFRKIILGDYNNEYNNSTTLGTCIHYLCSELNKTNISLIDKEIFDYINSLDSLIVDKKWIKDRYLEMQEEVIKTIEENNFMFNCTPTEVESSYVQKLTDRVYLGGTLDCRYKNWIIDYKTTSNRYLKQDSEIPINYLNQLYAYCFLLKQKNIDIDNLCIQYFTVPDLNRYSEKTNKQLKSYPCTSILLNTCFEMEKYNEVINLIKLISETIEYILDNKQSLGYFARDLELKFKD